MNIVPAKGSQSYIVKPGDDLQKIANLHGIANWQTVYQWNRGPIGGDPNRLIPGTRLTLHH